MQVLTKTLSSEDAAKILATEESHFVDLRAPRKIPYLTAFPTYKWLFSGRRQRANINFSRCP